MTKTPKILPMLLAAAAAACAVASPASAAPALLSQTNAMQVAAGFYTIPHGTGDDATFVVMAGRDETVLTTTGYQRRVGVEPGVASLACDVAADELVVREYYTPRPKGTFVSTPVLASGSGDVLLAGEETRIPNCDRLDMANARRRDLPAAPVSVKMDFAPTAAVGAPVVREAHAIDPESPAGCVFAALGGFNMRGATADATVTGDVPVVGWKQGALGVTTDASFFTMFTSISFASILEDCFAEA